MTRKNPAHTPSTAPAKAKTRDPAAGRTPPGKAAAAGTPATTENALATKKKSQIGNLQPPSTAATAAALEAVIKTPAADSHPAATATAGTTLPSRTDIIAAGLQRLRNELATQGSADKAVQQRGDALLDLAEAYRRLGRRSQPG